MQVKKIKKTIPKKKNGFKIEPYMVIIGLPVICFTCYLMYYLFTSSKHLIPISALAIILGVIYESKRLSDKWTPILLSVLAVFEEHIQMLPYAFILIFSLISIVFHGDKVVPKLTEGITLLQSIAVVYWFIDYGLVDIDNWFILSIMLFGLIFVLFAVVNAFTYMHLSRTNRLMLSIWSSIIMMLFAIDNILGIYQNEQIENTKELTHGLYVALQYFLLGVSCIYIIQNMIMLAGFLPGKRTFFNKQYFTDIKELKKDHIKRYSQDQVTILHSFFCLLSAGTVFMLNFYYQILPGHLAIWIMFITFPYMISFFDYLMERRVRINKS